MKNSLLLPKTNFPLRPLPGTEDTLLTKWADGLPRKSNGAPFVLHDGPPFANGAPHMGTALNKILKDFTVKSRSMAGWDVSFRPGWDCHGLPTELKAQTAGATTAAGTRAACKKLALEAVDLQKKVFRRLGVLAEWDKPYLTMEYPHVVVKAFAEFLRRNLVYFARKPVWWSVGAQTALAQMELEYWDETETAVVVEFPSDEFSFVAWTTTPWTLPANRALAVSRDGNYLHGTFGRRGERKTFVVATACADNLGEWELLETLAVVKGDSLVGLKAKSPFGGTVPVLAADFVSPTSGTGVVHVAPGHGHDDYLLGLKHGLEVFSPVDAMGFKQLA